VVLQVVEPEVPVSPVISPTGLIFVGQQGGSNPQPQTVTISNLSRRPVTFSTSSYFEQGDGWFAATPASGSAVADQPAQLTIQPNTSGLAAGVYKGELSVRFAEDNSLRRITVLLVVVPRPGVSSTGEGRRFAEGCTPQRLYPVFTALGGNFQTTAAWPTTLEIRVVDDCGDMMTAGTVNVTFSSGDPPVSLISLRDGRWTGTWQPRNQNARQVTISVLAQITAPPLEGTAQIGGGVQANNTTPVLASWGAVSAASYQQQWPVAPGSLVAIFGSRLADGLTASPSLPLATELAGTEVVLAGRSVPLQFTSDGQINAVIPYDIPVNSIQQMLVRKGASYSVPEPVNVATAQPAVFTHNQRGDGSGIVVAIKPGGQQVIVGPDAAATAGDVLVIYCTGLGAVDQRVDAGTAAPSEPLARTVNPVTATLAGRQLQVLFAGLAPGFTGLYQVNAMMPEGIAQGDAPLVLTVSEQSSAPVTVAVR
jgi:adhesin/invasin